MADWGLTELQIATIDAIVGVFEGGRPFRYETVARVKSDPGGLSFGKHQVSHTSGNLHTLMSAYCDWPKADPDLVAQVNKQLPRLKVPAFQKGDKEKQRLASLETKRLELIGDDDLKSLLVQTAADRAMCDTQDKYFYDSFMVPALTTWQAFGFKRALSAAVAYDSQIQSGTAFRAAQKEAADQKAGPPSAANEQAWIAAYVDARRQWLSESSSEAVRSSVYRMDAMKELIDKNAWDLALPLHVNKYDVTAWDNFSVQVFEDPYRRSGFEAFGQFARNVNWTGRGRFINQCLISLKLLEARAATNLGKFDDVAVGALKAYQTKCGLPPSGTVDAATFDKLCADAAVADEKRAKAGPATPDGFKALPAEPKPGAPVASTAGSLIAAGGAAAAAAAGSSDKQQDTPGVGAPESAVFDSPAAAPAPAPASTTGAAPATPAAAPAVPMPTPQTHPGSTTASTDIFQPVEKFFHGPLGTVTICGVFLLAIAVFAFAGKRWN